MTQLILCIVSKCAKRIYFTWNLSKAGVPHAILFIFIVQLSYLFWSSLVIITAQCTMHSAKRGLAIAYRLSVCDVGDL